MIGCRSRRRLRAFRSLTQGRFGSRYVALMRARAFSARAALWAVTVPLIAGCAGAKRTVPSTYVVAFEPPDSLVSRASAPARRSRTIVLTVDDGTCFPGTPPSKVASRLDHVSVRESSYAAVVTIFMRPEREPPKQADGKRWCNGVGVLFRHVIRLRRPLGDRALVDGGFPGPTAPRPTIVVPASDKQLERVAEARFGAPD